MAEKNGESHHSLIVQPNEGAAPVIERIDAAKKSLRVKQFTLTEPAIIAALIRAHGRGVGVRIMLNPHRSSGDRANDESFKALHHARLKVEWTNPPSR